MGTMLDVKSSVFGANETIPAKYTCDGEGVSPPLSWSNVPDATMSLAILVDDPDAPNGPFTHWLVTDLPPTITTLGEGCALPHEASISKSDAGNTSYYGPCPAQGCHRYRFHVYALDTTIGRTKNREDFLSAIDGHVLDDGELVATYQKQAR
jgi:Raf kinase inhibitor-like YbhB/YbcL family protein